MTDDIVLDLDAPEETPERPPFRFRFGGETFTARPMEEIPVWDVKALVENADKDPSVLLDTMLPPDEIERLEALDKVFGLGDLRRTWEAYEEHYGVTAPKSRRSPGPSKRTTIK